MIQPTTPEEKLLRIIESPLAKTQKEQELKDRLKKDIRPKGFGLKGLLNLFRRRENVLSIKNINKALAGASVLLTIFALADFGIKFAGLKENIGVMEGLSYDDISYVEREFAVKVKPDEILRRIQARDPFIPVIYEKEITISPDTEEAKKRLKLVGIIWSTNPQAMIEDERDKRTYLVSAGESIAGGILIKEISRDKAVVVSEEGEMWELR
jgi:hypothetical protein